MIQARAYCLRTPESLRENESRRSNSARHAPRTCCKRRPKELPPICSCSSRQHSRLRICAKSCSESGCMLVETEQLLHGELRLLAEGPSADHPDRNQNAGAYRISRIPVASRFACHSGSFLPTPFFRIIRAAAQTRFPHGESYFSGHPIPSRNFP